MEWGVLSETDGSIAGWENRQEEALLDVHRPLMPHLLTRTLRDVDEPAQLLDGAHIDPATPGQSDAGYAASSSRTRSYAARTSQNRSATSFPASGGS